MSGAHQTNYPPSMMPKGSDVAETLDGSADTFNASSFQDTDGRFYSNMVFLQVLGEDCHYTLDGTIPTGAGSEYKLFSGDERYISIGHLLAMTFIRPSGSSSTGTLRATPIG